MNKLFYCNHCVNCKQTFTKNIKTKSGKNIELTDSSITNGFIEFQSNTISSFNCPKCHNSIQELSLTIDEWEILKQVSTDSNFILAMDKLKQDDVIEFNLKLTQFKSQPQQQESAPQPTPNIPKCPTCGSTNVKKISGTKRWVGTGLFGIASSDLEKVMQCKSCGAKW